MHYFTWKLGLVSNMLRMIVDQHKVTTENYYPLSETSVFFELGNTESA